MNEPFSSCLLLLQRARRFIIYARLTIAINQTKFYNSNFPHLARYFWCGKGLVIMHRLQVIGPTK